MRSGLIMATLAGAGLWASVSTADACTYKVALDGTFAPHAMPTLNGKTEGFNVDLANALGQEMGCTMEITAAQFSGLIPAMQAGTYDFIVAPTTVTKERAEQMLFIEGFLNTDFQFVVKKGGPKISKLEELKGQTISVNKGSAYDQWARGLESQIGWVVESYGTQTDAVQAVISGRAVANVAGNTVIQWAVKKNPQLELSYYHTTGLVWSMPFRKDSVELRNKVEEALECLKQEGAVAKLSEKWFGVSPAAGAAAVTVVAGYGVPDMPGYDPKPHTPKCS